MSVVVIGATGQLGRLVVEDLLERGVAPAQIVATGRNTAKLADLAERGVNVQTVDLTDGPALAAALEGADKVLLVSTNEVGSRLANHQRAIDAAKAAGVSLLAYTSIPKADTTAMALAEEHRETEVYLQSSGVPYAFLRNSWYLENYTAQLPTYQEHHAVLGSAGDGRVSAATRADYAAAAAAVLTTDGHAGAVYELGGDQAFTLTELAAALSSALGEEIVYTDLPEEKYVEVLTGAGLPPVMAQVLANADTGLAKGDLFVDSGDLTRLIGRPTTTLTDAIARAIG
jgi:NAD(P)H dehydrogenase (quinone)